MQGITFQDFFRYSFWGNNLENVFWFVLIIVAGFLFKRVISVLLSKVAFKLIKKASGGTHVMQFVNLLRKPFELLITLIVIYIASRFIDLPEFMKAKGVGKLSVQELLFAVYKLLLIASVAWILLRTVDFFGIAALRTEEEEGFRHRRRLVPFLKELLKVVLVLLTVSVMLSGVFHVNISALVAGLGIGGLAIALAARDTLENLLSSFTIFLDKPFKVGDVVKNDVISGTIERVGFRSTGVRTIDKTKVTVPNRMMVDRPLENITLRLARKVNLMLRLEPSVSAEKVKAAIEELRTFVHNHPKSTKDEEIHLFDFEPGALTIRIGYALDVDPYVEYLDLREEINFKIMNILESHGLHFMIPPPAHVNA